MSNAVWLPCREYKTWRRSWRTVTGRRIFRRDVTTAPQIPQCGEGAKGQGALCRWEHEIVALGPTNKHSLTKYVARAGPIWCFLQGSGVCYPAVECVLIIGRTDRQPQCITRLHCYANSVSRSCNSHSWQHLKLHHWFSGSFRNNRVRPTTVQFADDECMN